MSSSWKVLCSTANPGTIWGIILCMYLANERRRYSVTSSSLAEPMIPTMIPQYDSVDFTLNNHKYYNIVASRKWSIFHTHYLHIIVCLFLFWFQLCLLPRAQLTHCGREDLSKWTIFNTILTSPKSWLSQEDLDAGCEHSLVPMDS